MARVVSIKDVKLKWLVFLKVVADEEALLEVRVEVIHYLFGAAEFSPSLLVYLLLRVDYAYGVRDTLADPIDIL